VRKVNDFEGTIMRTTLAVIVLGVCLIGPASAGALGALPPDVGATFRSFYRADATAADLHRDFDRCYRDLVPRDRVALPDQGEFNACVQRFGWARADFFWYRPGGTPSAYRLDQEACRAASDPASDAPGTETFMPFVAVEVARDYCLVGRGWKMMRGRPGDARAQPFELGNLSSTSAGRGYKPDGRIGEMAVPPCQPGYYSVGDECQPIRSRAAQPTVAAPQVSATASAGRTQAGASPAAGFVLPSKSAPAAAPTLDPAPRRKPPLSVELGLTVEPRTSPPVVAFIVSTTPAGRAGVRAGDVVLAIDGASIATENDIANVLAGKRPGDHLDIELRRGRQSVTVRPQLVAPQRLSPLH
jgi:hypothetical protein